MIHLRWRLSPCLLSNVSYLVKHVCGQTAALVTGSQVEGFDPERMWRMIPVGTAERGSPGNEKDT